MECDAFLAEKAKHKFNKMSIKKGNALEIWRTDKLKGRMKE